MVKYAFFSMLAAIALAIAPGTATAGGFGFRSAPVCVGGSCFSGRSIVVQDSPVVFQRSAPVVLQQAAPVVIEQAAPQVIVEQAAPVIIRQRALRVRRGLFGRLIIR